MAGMLDEAIAYWKLDDAANTILLTDSSGNSNTATTNGTTTTAGFNGEGLARTLPDKTYIVKDNILPSGSDFTMSAWLNLAVANGPHAGASYGYYLLGMTTRAAGGIAVGVIGNNLSISYYGTGGHGGTLSSIALKAGEWIHVALVKKGNFYSLYHNGVLVASTTQTHSVGTTFASCYVNGSITSYARSAGAAYDEVAVWNKPLTDAEVLRVYEGAIGLTLFSSSDKKIRKFIHKDSVDAVPAMTSNTSPLGVARASSIYSATYDAWAAFDKIITNGSSDCWATINGTIAGWLEYEFDKPKVINKYYIEPRGAVSSSQLTAVPRAWTLEGSNDGINYSVLDKIVDSSGWTANERREFIFRNYNSYKQYRLNITANNGNADFTAIGSFELHEDVSGEIVELTGELEQSFLEHGMSAFELRLIDVEDLFRKKSFVNYNKSPLDNGKVFIQSLDINKGIKSVLVK